MSAAQTAIAASQEAGPDHGTDLAALVAEIGRKAKAASHVLGNAPAEQRAAGLSAAAAAIRAATADIMAANARDLDAGKAKGLTGALMDRLALSAARIEAMAAGIETVAALPDPLGRVLAETRRPNGLRIERVSVPIGVIGIIYESRPNVTADAGSLCLKAGNAAILRGGSESFHSSAAIVACLHRGLTEAGLPEDAVQTIPTTDRAAVGHLLRLDRYVDVIVPRGGQSLIERVMRESTIPVFGHLQGLCHTYLHQAADRGMALDIVRNAKLRRPGICGATETVLVDAAAAERLLAPVTEMLLEAGCAVRGDAATQAVDPRVTPASEEDWRTEYLDAIVSIRVVDGLEAAIAHINEYGSHHTDSIVTEDAAAADRFLKGVDSGIVMHNASTQFADGGEFGMGAEIGIATGKLHARGPVGAEQLTSYQYRVHGTGQTRP